MELFRRYFILIILNPPQNSSTSRLLAPPNGTNSIFLRFILFYFDWNLVFQGLELIAHELDNSSPESWNCINQNGSPNVINNSNLAVEYFEINDIKVYPNPVNDKLFIGGSHDRFDVEVYSILGQKVDSVLATNQLDLSTFDTGVYFIKIKTNNQTVIKKIIKN